MNPKDVDVRALAKLARLHVSDGELEKLAEELPGILRFVEAVQNAPVSQEVTAPTLRNVMRTDEHPHESGLYTERLLNAAPAQEKGRVVVKQVLSRKK
ncbi:aspartyl/glutamyl-tRNA amidotransferase subunit C [Candidatus Parcubacteria bacterium]|nr:MAG: aspartyl/glutamyl-tRNA amidotransferase subunit C [Candidatus Parcubacteria bacterium]